MEVSRMSSGNLPAGLEYCPICGGVRGETRELPDDWIPEEEGETAVSTCFCEGRRCAECGRRNLRRPVSSYYDPADGMWWHVPYFMGIPRVCQECEKRK